MPESTDPLPQLAALLARATRDAQLRDRMLRDPHATLRAEGISIPAGLKVNVIANNASTVHMVLPDVDTELHESELDAIAGGGRAIERMRERHGGRRGLRLFAAGMFFAVLGGGMYQGE